jgi:hypothetical protein
VEQRAPPTTASNFEQQQWQTLATLMNWLLAAGISLLLLLLVGAELAASSLLLLVVAAICCLNEEQYNCLLCSPVVFPMERPQKLKAKKTLFQLTATSMLCVHVGSCVHVFMCSWLNRPNVVVCVGNGQLDDAVVVSWTHGWLVVV